MNITKDYMTIKEIADEGIFTSYMWSEIVREYNIARIRKPESNAIEYLYPKAEVMKYKKMKDKFWNEHKTYRDIIKMYTLSILSETDKVKIPFYAKKGNSGEAYSIKSIEQKLNKVENNYLYKDEARKVLDLSPRNFEITIKELKVESILFRNRAKFLKKDIENIRKMQEDLLEKVVFGHEIGPATQALKSKPLPVYLRRKDRLGDYRVSVYYDKKKFDDYNLKINNNSNRYNAEADGLFETYLSRLNTIDVSSLDELPYTKNKIYSFVDTLLKQSGGSDFNVNRNINQMVNLTQYIAKFLDENRLRNGKQKEYYSLTSSEINLFISTLSSVYPDRVYAFTKLVAQDIAIKRAEIKTSKGFSMKNIKNPSNKNKLRGDDVNSLGDDIYTYEEFVEISKFLLNYEYHFDKITELLKNKSKKRDIDIMRYLSSWLYFSLQLANASRGIEIVNLPRMNFDYVIEKENINNLEWFFENKINPHTSSFMTSRIKDHKFFRTKTGADATYRVSENIGMLINTIILMIEVFYKSQSIVVEHEFATNFCRKNNIPDRRSDIWKFFEDIEIPDFKFGNRKMNKTLMTFSKAVVPAEYGIYVAQQERDHRNINTTLIYAKTPREYLEFLSENIFERGEFGYIYDTLIDIVSGNSEKMELIEERTDLIKTIKNSFGNEMKLEASIKLANYYNQIDVINMLYEKGLDECNNILNKIYFKDMPSKEKDVQCLFSETDCPLPERGMYPKKDGCLGCKYSIPNIFSLSTVSDRLKMDFKAYNDTTNKVAQRKLSMRIYKYKEIMKEAIQKYGKEHVYGVLGLDMDGQEFRETLASITPPSEIFKSIY